MLVLKVLHHQERLPLAHVLQVTTLLVSIVYPVGAADAWHAQLPRFAVLASRLGRQDQVQSVYVLAVIMMMVFQRSARVSILLKHFLIIFELDT